VSQREGLSFDQQPGCLVLLRDRQELAAARSHLRALAEMGVEFKLIDAAGARAVEPGLSTEAPLHAAVYLRQALSGNGRLLAQGLRAAAIRSGARFCFARRVLEVTAGRHPEIRHRAEAPERDGMPARRDPGPLPPPDADSTESGVRERFDAVVVCAAMGAPALLQELRIPLKPVHGCSITLPLRDGAEAGASTTALVDQRHQVSITRHAGRLRLAGGIGLFGSASGQPAAVENLLYRVLDDWLAGPVDRVKAQRWKGSRPSMPDGLPMLGPSGAAGIWLNLGHGGGGMALACGSARVVADLVNRRRPDIDIEGLDAGRLR
jgi:D-amino-acid dehydrogenase